MAKKTKNDNELCVETVSIRITKEQKQVLEEAAAKEKRTLSNYLKMLLGLV